MKRLHTALILAIGFTFVMGGLPAQVPISTSGAPHWQEKMNLSKYALHQDVFITSGITLLNSAGTSNIGELSSADLVALAAGKKINGGTSNVTTSATVASGLSAVTSVVASLGVAPSANTSMVHAEVSGTNVVLYTYKATGASTTTLIPSTTATAIHWIAFGT